ncbi:MAG: hypothetical protein HC843_12485 [Sphingomonadales bacterium]|nr:hypothetical protein [Sphingomonadales bacterium]
MLILYSTVTRLAYTINEKYYGGIHYVWCAPEKALDPNLPTNAVSSDPWYIYRQFANAVKTHDKHDEYIKNNRAGIIRGAAARLGVGMIDEDQKNEIEELVNMAETPLFAPRFMVIPYVPVKDLVEKVPLQKKASPVSEEFIIGNLPRNQFDIWEWIT